MLTPWMGWCRGYRKFGGFRVPADVEVGMGGGRAEFAYARLDATAIEYNVAG